MKVNDPNLSSLAQRELAQSEKSSAAASKVQQQDTQRTHTGKTGGTEKAHQVGSGTPAQDSAAVDGAARDDVHLSELVRSLRSLAADSPQRAARLEQIARAYTQGNYNVDAEGTAQGIIDDAFRSR